MNVCVCVCACREQKKSPKDGDKAEEGKQDNDKDKDSTSGSDSDEHIKRVVTRGVTVERKKNCCERLVTWVFQMLALFIFNVVKQPDKLIIGTYAPLVDGYLCLCVCGGN